MSTSPQPPRSPIPPQAPPPPVAPQPPRSGSNVVAIALLVLALIVLVSGIAVWTGLRFLSHNLSVQVKEQGGSQKDVAINTPIGSMEVHKDVNTDNLDLPIYPGAIRIKDKDSATVNFAFGGEAGVRIMAARFETTDSPEAVKSFYKEHLGSAVTKFTDHGLTGKSSFEIKDKDLEKVVEIETEGAKTVIKLVRIAVGKGESN
ncbi:MAG: hypothetical protein ABSH52_02890 [Terriglobia bacterium]|jgi:hypothetical protein